MRIKNMTIAQKITAFDNLVNKNSTAFNIIFSSSKIKGNHSNIQIGPILRIGETMSRTIYIDGSSYVHQFCMLRGKSAALAATKTPNPKKTYTVTVSGTTTEYLGAQDAANALGISRSSVQQHAKSDRHIHSYISVAV